jgi:hypothetical protein
MARFLNRPEAYRVAMRPGQDVTLKSGPRQEGKVVAVFSGNTIRVKWSNGWKSDHLHTELEKA